jgi:hypothetical protein
VVAEPRPYQVYEPDVPPTEASALVGARPGLRFTDHYRTQKEQEQERQRALGAAAAAKPGRPQ